MNYIFRLIKRLIVLIPGIAVTYVAVADIWPHIHKHLPYALAIFITYVITAYILIPALMRIIRTIVRPKHVPLYCTTPDGFASDPINTGVISTRQQLILAMTKAGWYQADPYSLPNLVKMVLTIVLKRPYSSAPCSRLYFFGRSQDIAFEQASSNNLSRRHHVRFWAATYTSDLRYRDHVYFWQKHLRAQTGDRVLWVGAASLDTGIRPIRHTGQLTHMVHPDTNAERELIVRQLKKTGMVQKTRTIKAGEPYELVNRVVGGHLVADGDLTICELKSS